MADFRFEGITRVLVRCALFWLLVSVLLVSVDVTGAEELTREAVIDFAAECKRLKVQMNPVDRFGTDFSGLDLSGVDFRAASTTPTGEFKRELRTLLRGANFQNCNLRGARFDDAILDDADFTGADLTDASFESTSLKNATLRNVHVTGTRFFYANLTEAKLPDLDLSQSDITAARFTRADLSGCRLTGTSFHFTWQADWRNADLSHADLRGLTFNHSDFRGANLRSANLSGSDLRHSDFSDSNLQDAHFTNARVGAAVFDRVRGVSDAELRRLTNAAWRYDLKLRVVAFLDSFAFPVSLLLAVPLVVVAIRGSTLRYEHQPTEDKSSYQFSLAFVLILTTVVAGYLALVLLSPTGAYSFAMVSAFYMMVAEILRGRGGRKPASGLLLCALSYTVLNVIVLRTIDPILLLDLKFGSGVIFLAPLVVIAGGVVFALILWRASKRAPVMGLLGFCIWMVGVGIANLWVIAAAMASV